MRNTLIRGTEKTDKQYPSNQKRSMVARNLVMAFVVLAIGWGMFAALAARMLIVEKPLQSADAIVVLSGSAAYVERTYEASLLFKAGIAPKVILTNDGLKGGWDESEERNLYFFERARRELIEGGVPENCIEILVTPVAGTIDEAELVIEKAMAMNYRSILLVTPPYHTRRALWTYQRVEAKRSNHLTVGIVAPMNWQQSPAWYDWWLSPRGWTMIPGEYLKLVYYSVRY